MTTSSKNLGDAGESSLPRPGDSCWSLIVNTSLGDLVRGRLSGNLDLRRVVEEAALPEPLPELIYRSVLAAGGTRGERARLARSLADRCRAVLSAGESPAKVASQFADPLDFAQFLHGIDRGSVCWRLVRTPLADVLRGRLNGSLDVRPIIQTAGLPRPVVELIRQVVLQTRLWPSEQHDVTEELSDHFRDGLAAGRNPAELVGSFGDRRNAARLIRRAKLRCRPLYWRAWRRARQATAFLAVLLLAAYLFFLVRYFILQPRLDHNYSLELTANGRNVSAAERAWPFYRAALISLSPWPKVEVPADPELPTRLEMLDLSKVKPGAPHWDAAVRWLEANQKSAELAREGAARSKYGFVYGDPDDQAWLEREKCPIEAMNLASNMPLISIRLPQVQQVRQLVWLLDLDARRAIDLNNGERFVADVSAIMAIGKQVRDDLPLLINYLVGLGMFESSLRLIDNQLLDESLHATSARLTETQWQTLAHRIAAVDDVELRPPL